MFRAGTVTRTAGGVLVVRSEDETVPEIGDTVVDDRLEPVGSIVDIFGPVDRPYLAVSPVDERRPSTVLGDPVYVRN